MAKVEWVCSIPVEGILGVQFFYKGDSKNGMTFTKASRISCMDRRLFIALTASILDGKEKYGLSRISHMGVYNDRNVRGSSVKSTHAFGLGIDISGLSTSNGIYWVEIDSHKETLESYAHSIFFKYFEDVITWDWGQYRDSQPHNFSYKTKELHKDHYHLNPSRWSRFRVKTDVYHNASIMRVLSYLGYNDIFEYQEEKILKPDGIPGKFTTLELIKDLGGKLI